MPKTVKQNLGHMKTEKDHSSVQFPDNHAVTRILCLNPVSAEMQKITTNRPETIFDSDLFKECILYSGTGLCKLLLAH